MLIRLFCLAAIVLTGCSQPANRAVTTQPATLPTTQAALSWQPVVPRKTLAEVEASARRDLHWLADDAREGRGLGTKGLEQAGDFIAGRFKKLGLVPLPSVGSYFEPFDFDAGDDIGPDTSLTLNGVAVPSSAFTAFTKAKPGAVKGSLAFVGYGIRDPDRGYDDYAGIDVKNRIVLAMRWEPHDENGRSQWEKRGDYTSNAAISRKADQAEKAGAAALVIVNAPSFHDDAPKLMDSDGALRRRANIPVFHVDIATANAMLALGRAPELATLQHEIDTTTKPASRLLDGVSCEVNLELIPAKNAARNVVAMLPGAGPHADEYVIVGAHYDHVGHGEYGSRSGSAGQIHNGADDNGSGTTALLQLAEEFALAGRQDRSIIFASFSLEELGLIGSEKFVEHLPVPKEKIVGMLNLDMVGRMRNKFLYVGGAGTADVFQSILDAADARSPIELKSMGKGGKGPSDHLSFSQIGIPVLFFYSGSHPDYHTPTDDADKINYEGLAQVTYLAFDVVRGMCAMERPSYVSAFDAMEPDVDVQAGEQPTTRRVGVVVRSRVTLGVEPDYTADTSVKGVLINDITPDSAAAAAGIKAKDVITKMNDRQIDNLHDLTGFLNDAKPGDVVKILVTRDGQPMTLEVTLRPRQRQ